MKSKVRIDEDTMVEEKGSKGEEMAKACVARRKGRKGTG